jgi:hypothetical protein
MIGTSGIEAVCAISGLSGHDGIADIDGNANRRDE